MKLQRGRDGKLYSFQRAPANRIISFWNMHSRKKGNATSMLSKATERQTFRTTSADRRTQSICIVKCQ
jgi:hypothetical protein